MAHFRISRREITEFVPAARHFAAQNARTSDARPYDADGGVSRD